MKIALVVVSFLLAPMGWASADVCDKWFAASKVKPGKNCMLECAVIPVDMGTFDCSLACADFCKESAGTDFLFKISDLYPGLTGSERALAAKYPKEALRVYINKSKAESICAKQFGDNRTNDESDACRHFVWAGLLRRDLGTELAQKFLNGHEDQPGQPKNQKEMDLANNKVGLRVSEKLEKAGIFSEESLVRELEAALSRKELMVIDPKFKDWKAR
jgi:hypothetical protein